MDAHPYISRRPPVSIWTYNVRPWASTSYYKDVQHNIHGRPSVSIWTSISCYMDVQYYISGRSSVSLWTYNMTSVDAPPPESLWAYNVWSWPSTIYYMDVQHFISVCPYFPMDVRHDIRGRPPVSTWTYKITSVDVHQFFYGCTKLHKRASISFSMDVQHNIRGCPPVPV